MGRGTQVCLLIIAPSTPPPLMCAWVSCTYVLTRPWVVRGTPDKGGAGRQKEGEPLTPDVNSSTRNNKKREDKKWHQRDESGDRHLLSLPYPSLCQTKMQIVSLSLSLSLTFLLTMSGEAPLSFETECLSRLPSGIASSTHNHRFSFDHLGRRDPRVFRA